MRENAYVAINDGPLGGAEELHDEKQTAIVDLRIQAVISSARQGVECRRACTQRAAAPTPNLEEAPKAFALKPRSLEPTLTNQRLEQTVHQCHG